MLSFGTLLASNWSKWAKTWLQWIVSVSSISVLSTSTLKIQRALITSMFSGSLREGWGGSMCVKTKTTEVILLNRSPHDSHTIFWDNWLYPQPESLCISWLQSLFRVQPCSKINNPQTSLTQVFMGRKVHQATEEKVQWTVVKEFKVHGDRKQREEGLSANIRLSSHTFFTFNGICVGDNILPSNSFILFPHRSYKSSLQSIFALAVVWKERGFDFNCSGERFKQPGLKLWSFNRYLGWMVVKVRVRLVPSPPLNLCASAFVYFFCSFLP